MPPAETPIDIGLVEMLLRSQHPDLADLPLRPVGAHGWDNTVFRLGNELAVRLPRREAAAHLVEHENRWLPMLAPRLPLPVPVPVLTGEPEFGYPWRWSVCRWVPGRPIGLQMCDPSLIAGFLTALHTPAPPEAPRNPLRGVPLAERDPRFRADCDVLRGGGWDTVGLLTSWDAHSAAPDYIGPPLWIHGDFHTANILMRNHGVSGVIDFGDMAAGDPACDYLAAWLLPTSARGPLRIAAERHGPGTWRRSQAWALAWGAAALSHSSDNPLIARLGERAIRAASAEAHLR